MAACEFTWRKNNSIHVTSWFVCYNSVTWKVMWQMEPRRAVAITCHAPLSAEPIFSLIRVCLAGSTLLYQCDQPFFFFRPLCISAFACLLSLQRRAGMRGTQASGLPVYAEGFLHCSPPASFEGFFTFLCSLLFWEQVMGSDHGSLPRGIPESLSGRAQQEFFPTAHIVCFVHTWDIFTAVN